MVIISNIIATKFELNNIEKRV